MIAMVVRSDLPSCKDYFRSAKLIRELSGLSVNMGNWAWKITIANPFTNPNITGCGIRRTKRPSFRQPHPI